jgi:hypothetical protein
MRVKLSEFSRLCGVSKPAVSNWKREKKLVMVGDLVDVDAFCTGEPPFRKRPKRASDA